MKNMKKVLFAGMTAAMLAAATLPALAENAAGAQTMSGMQQQARGGRGGQNMRGGQPGRQNPDAQQPEGGNNGSFFRGGRGAYDSRMNPRMNGQTPDAQNPDSGSAEDGISGATGKRFPGMRGGHRGGRGRNAAQALVEQGVIDQETADKIETYFREKKTEDMTAKLVEDGVIDQETADKISAFLESMKPQVSAEEAPAEAPAEGGDPALAALVEQGVITQEQADAIEAARGAQPDPEGDTEI